MQGILEAVWLLSSGCSVYLQSECWGCLGCWARCVRPVKIKLDIWRLCCGRESRRLRTSVWRRVLSCGPSFAATRCIRPELKFAFCEMQVRDLLGSSVQAPSAAAGDRTFLKFGRGSNISEPGPRTPGICFTAMGVQEGWTAIWVCIKIKQEGLRVLVHVSTYQGSILVPVFGATAILRTLSRRIR